MIHYITRIASLVLAFGFFISCSTLSTSEKSNKHQSSENLSEAQLQNRVDSLDKKISSGTITPELFYQKGLFLTELARKKESPSDRRSSYADAHDALKQASKLYSSSSNEAEREKAQELLKVTWSNEHNQGVQIMQSDSSMDSPNYQLAAAHFNNATIIIPDSSISYKMEARAYYKNQQLQQSIDVLEKAQSNIQQLPVPMLEQLAFLYLETDQPQSAVEVYEEANSFSDQNLNLLHGLSNAYISAGQHREAIELLRVLIENKPANIIYGQSLATELYRAAAGKMDSVITDLQNGKELNNTAFSTADSLITEAESQFKRILNENPEDFDLKHNFAHFYKNSAAKYQKVLPLVDQQAKQRLRNQIKQHLSSSVPLYEQLVEKQPSEKGVWRSLFQAYTYLGMEEKAREAKANF